MQMVQMVHFDAFYTLFNGKYNWIFTYLFVGMRWDVLQLVKEDSVVNQMMAMIVDYLANIRPSSSSSDSRFSSCWGTSRTTLSNVD